MSRNLTTAWRCTITRSRNSADEIQTVCQLLLESNSRPLKLFAEPPKDRPKLIMQHSESQHSQLPTPQTLVRQPRKSLTTHPISQDASTSTASPSGHTTFFLSSSDAARERERCSCCPSQTRIDFCPADGTGTWWIEPSWCWNERVKNWWT